MGEIKAIETFYDGYRFRSRLEARWAVFFHESGIPYVYEPEGFRLDEHIFYLPDFYLPWFSAYVEIKPNYIDEEKEKEAKDKLELLYFTTSKETMIFFGDPVDKNMELFCCSCGPNDKKMEWEWRNFRFLEGAWYSDGGIDRGYTKHYVNISVFSNKDEIIFNAIKGKCFDDDGCCFSFRSDFRNEALLARQARFEHGEAGA